MDSHYQGPPRKVIIDTDAGIDDAVALFMALAAHKNPKIPFDIIAITTVLGNTSLENVCKNVFIVLDSAGVNDIQVYSGAAKPLVQLFNRGAPYSFMGEDGFGGVQSSSSLPIVRRERKLEEEFAPLALSRLAKEFKGELTVVALGPLTNIAIAINVDPHFEKHVKELHVMGGNIHAVGNIRPSAEFNFYVDPESAFVVLAAAWNEKIVLTPWETCKSAMSPMEWRKQILGARKSKQMQLLNLVEEKVLIRMTQRYGKWMSADAVCMGALLNPNMISLLTTNHCVVELQGAHTRGQMVVDYQSENRKDNTHNVSIVEQINLTLLEEMLVSTFDEATFSD